MKHKIVITAIMLALALPAAAQFTTISAAYEVSLSDIRLPQNPVGTIAYKKCSTCPYETKRVDTTTVWELNGRALPLEQFKRAIEGVADPNGETIQVLHQLKEDRIKKVWILLQDS